MTSTASNCIPASSAAFERPLPRTIIIGATGRNAGKTRLAASIIEFLSRGREVVGVKVTPVDAERGCCPRGGKGCGACDALEGEVVVEEDRQRSSATDTGRMLLAGAAQALWVRCRRERLAEACTALRERIPPGALCVCESTSLRSVARPDLFLMAVHSGDDDRKRSAGEVWPHVDRFVLFDGKRFDFDLCDLSVSGGRWALRRDATAIVMAGGESRRMGQDKALLKIDGVPLIMRIVDGLRPHFKEILISANDSQRYSFLKLPVIPDREPRRGPLMGIASALEAAVHDTAFVHACDIPDTDVDLAQMLLRACRGCVAAVPRSSSGRLEPLFAAYRKEALPAMREMIASGESRIRPLFERCPTTVVEIDRALVLGNLNTLEEYGAYTRLRPS